jgi:hypothetical protein
MEELRLIDNSDELLALPNNQKVNITGEALNWVISLTKMREEKDGRHVTFTVPGGGGYVIIGKIGDDPLEIFWG